MNSDDSKRGKKQPSKLTTNPNKQSQPGKCTTNKSADNDDDRPCLKCKGIIHESIKAMQCEFCAEWVCLDCTGMPEVTYDAIMNNNIPNFIWSCDSCVKAVPTIKNLSNMLQDMKT